MRYDANAAKGRVHAGILTAAGQPGTLLLYGTLTAGAQHAELSGHLTAERPVRVWSEKHGEQEIWQAEPGRPNHYLDCLAGCLVVAGLCGIPYPEAMVASARATTTAAAGSDEPEPDRSAEPAPPVKPPPAPVMRPNAPGVPGWIGRQLRRPGGWVANW